MDKIHIGKCLMMPRCYFPRSSRRYYVFTAFVVIHHDFGLPIANIIVAKKCRCELDGVVAEDGYLD